MSNKKLFASDFDGTLSEYPDGVTAKSFEMIDKFRAEGNFFGIITGRNIDNVRDIYKLLHGHIDFLMCMTGAYATDGEGNYLFDSKGDGSVLPELIRCIVSEGGRYLCWADMNTAYEVDMLDPLEDEGPVISEARRHKTFTQLNTMFGTEEDVARAVAHMMRLYGDKINPQINGLCVDIPPAGVSKGGAVLRMAKLLGVSAGNIFTAGDNINDVSMLKEHYGFSVPGGRAEARAAAREVLPDVGDMLLKVMNMK